jgi:hypothetical protein
MYDGIIDAAVIIHSEFIGTVSTDDDLGHETCIAEQCGWCPLILEYIRRAHTKLDIRPGIERYRAQVSAGGNIAAIDPCDKIISCYK